MDANGWQVFESCSNKTSLNSEFHSLLSFHLFHLQAAFPDYKASLFSVPFMRWILPCPLKKAQDLLSQMYVYVYVCMHVCMSLYLYVYMYVCALCMCVCVCGFVFASSKLPWDPLKATVSYVKHVRAVTHLNNIISYVKCGKEKTQWSLRAYNRRPSPV